MPYRSRRRTRFRRPRFNTRRRFVRRNPKKKYNPGKWRRHLLSDTHSNTHYRSLLATPFAHTTGTLGANNILRFDKHLALPIATPFWTAAGGAQAVDTGNPVPGFGRNIVIRGGRITCQISLRSTATETVKVTVFLVYRKPCSDATILPVAGDRSILWDPSVEADFTRYGRVLWKKQAILEPQTGSASVQMFHNLRPQKVDHENFEQSGSHLEWVTCYQKISATGAAIVTLDVIQGHSLSFSGDEIS